MPNDGLKRQHEWAAGQRLVDWLNTQRGAAYEVKDQPPPPEPDLIIGDASGTVGLEVVTAYYDEDDATLRWTRSPGAAGYKVVWREAWASDWTYSRTVTDTTIVFPDLTIDDYVFGVAAVGPGGHESLVSAYVLPPRR